jgi:hypothetical protein
MGRADQTPYRAIHNAPHGAGGPAQASATCKEEGVCKSTIQAAIYARVSSERQATAQTIASQLAALRERVATDECALPEAMQFLDDGYSGTTLVRPALERLRDLVAAGAVDRLYIHSPDR